MDHPDKQVAVVTGAGGGLGAGIARLLAAQGMRVVVNDVTRPDGASPARGVADDIAHSGGEAVAVAADVSTWAGGEELIAKAVDAYGAVHALVTCAGNFVNAPLADLTEPEWQNGLDVHLKGSVACAQAAARRMVDQGAGGTIVTVSSRGAFFSPGPAYASAKAGVMGLTSAMAMNLREHGITVNCVLPSATTGLFPATAPRTFGGMPPSTDMRPETVAPLVAYLVGPQARDVTDRFFYASGGDIAVYARPLSMEASPVLVRNPDGWQVSDLDDALRPLLQVAGRDS